MVDRDGSIFFGTQAGVARVKFGDNGFWRLAPVTAWAPPGSAVPLAIDQAMVTEAANTWIWHANRNGALVVWRPGETARPVGQVNTFEHVFQLGETLFVSDRTNGALSRLDPDRMVPVMTGGTRSAITCSVPFDKKYALVGTSGLGLQLFDGQVIRPFPGDSILSSGARINDLCITDAGYFAAAIDNVGVVVFNRNGRTMQVLDRALDQRLAQVSRLRPGPGGVVWGLTEGGVLRVELPARVSHFESLINAGYATVHPHRLDGRLWLWADGKAYRGRYSAEGRLLQFDVDSPGQLFATSFSGAMGLPVVGTEEGAYCRTASGWVEFSSAIRRLNIVDPTPVNGRWLYVGLNEVGWLERRKDGVVVAERIPVPELGAAFNRPVRDKRGRIWLELGLGRIGRVQLEQGVPTVKIFSTQDGTGLSWPQIFELHGVVGFNLSTEICRFDDATQRFVPDPEFLQRIPGGERIVGRPGIDSRGRLWVAGDRAVKVYESKNGRWLDEPLIVPLGFQPFDFSFQDDGVVWMRRGHRFSRYDPNVPVSPPVPLRALITHVNLSATNRFLFAPGAELPPLGFSENSLVFHYVALGNSLAIPVTFDVKLEGAGTDWVSTGSAGSAAFSRLKEGRYVLHVRPQSGGVSGEVATLALTVLPPWYRTPIAYLGYILSALGAVLLAAWLLTVLERRENARLEHLVIERTGELSRSNALLASQVEEIRVLTRAIVQSPIAVFITRPDGVIEFANPRGGELTGCATEKLVGSNLHRLRAPTVRPPIQAAIATAMERGDSWSGQLAYRQGDGRIIQVRSTLSPISSPDGQTRQNLILEEDITQWLEDQQRSQRLEARLIQAQKIESIGTLAGGIAHDFNNILTGILGYCELADTAVTSHGDVRAELQQIRAAGLRAKDLVMQILTFSRQGNAKLVPVELAHAVGEALKLIRASTPATIELVENLERGTILADATQIHQIVINLCTNAVQAMKHRAGRLEISLRKITVDERLAAEIPNLKPGATLRLTVTDNGQGMSQATLARIFDPFFTTKAQGEGTGLGLAIVQGVVVSHGGALHVSSELEVGTRFELYFPCTAEAVSAPAVHPVAPARGQGQEILLVDDEPAVAKFASSCLDRFGYHAVCFNDPRAALAAFAAAPGRFAAIVTDLTMPHLTGLELVMAARGARPTIPAVVLTGYGRDEILDQLALLPDCVLLQKPFGGDDLVRTLNRFLEADGAEKFGVITGQKLV